MGETVLARQSLASPRLTVSGEQFTDFLFRRDTTQLGSSYKIDLEATVRSSNLGGTFRCATSKFMSGIAGKLPNSGQIDCSGAGTVRVRLVNFEDIPDAIQFSTSSADEFEKVDDYSWDSVASGYYTSSSIAVPVQAENTPPLIPTQTISLQTNDLASPAAGSSLYVAVGADSARNANSLARIDVNTGEVLDVLPFEDEPVVLGISADDSTLYVGFRFHNVIRQVDLVRFEQTAIIDLGASGGDDLVARHITVSPADTSEIVVSLFNAGQGLDNFRQTALFRNSVKQPKILAPEPVSIAEYTSGTTLYGGDSVSSGHKIHIIDVLADGLEIRESLERFAFYYRPFAVENETIYTSDGEHIEPENKALLGRYRSPAAPIAGVRRVIPDTPNNRVYFAGDVLEVFEQNRYRPLAAYRLPDDIPATAIVLTNSGMLTIGTASALHLVSEPSIVPDTSSEPCTPGTLNDPVNVTEFPLLECRFHDALYLPGRNRVYALTQGVIKDIGNSLIEIHPQTLQIERQLYLGSEPVRLTAPDDESMLFVSLEGAAEIVQVDLVDFRVANRSRMRVSEFDGPIRPGDIEVVPGRNDSVAVVLRVPYSTSYHGVALFVDGAELPLNSYDRLGPAGTEIVFADSPNQLYTLDIETSTASDFSVAEVNTSGISHLTPLFDAGRTGAQLKYAERHFYLSTGEVISVDQQALIGGFSLGEPGRFNDLVEPVVSEDNVFFHLPLSDRHNYRTPARYRLSTRNLIDWLDFPRFGRGSGRALQLESMTGGKLLLVKEDRMLVVDVSQFIAP